MKKIIFLLPIVFLLSCSVQKRKYLGGFHVNWNKQVKNTRENSGSLTKANVAKKPAQPVAVETEAILKEDVFEASAVTKNVTALVSKKDKRTLPGDDPCDEVIFRDGSEIKARVTEITVTEIKYKKCDMPDGPSYVAKKSDVFMIKYANGTREVFKHENATTTTGAGGGKTNYKGPKRVHPLAIGSLIMGILCLVPYISLLTAILAIVFGNKALRAINAQPDVYKGEGMAIAGKTIGIIVLSIVLAVLLLFVLILLLAAA